MGWSPDQYLKFAAPRLRPALDLLARIDLEQPRLIYDLGCGAGNVTALLANRWPQARIVGVDSSSAMLDRAAKLLPQAEWVLADLAQWQPSEAADLVFSNAALHWVDDHARFLPWLVRALAPGGVLALQMPANFTAPSHRSLFAAALSGPWQDLLRPLLRENPVGSPEDNWAILAEVRPEIWETTYLHALTGEDPVLEWIMGTSLRPLLEALPEGWQGDFLAVCRDLLAKAYPRRANGVTLFPFRRQFILAKKI